MIGRGGREGRDRFRRDYNSRSEEKSQYGRNSNPPSRHLWVGNLSHHISESILSEHFLRFGELESIAFQPGRSYAFVNFRKDEDALIAVRALQGFVLAGFPLKIEFAKAERSLASSHDEEYPKRRDERFSAERESPFFQRDSRPRLSSLEPSFPDNSRMGDKNAEPSEVLWIGFPAFLNVDEMILRRAFSPFGEIVKITAFPGRSYAFVQFRTIPAACRAKEALQGKLFNNPRVNICFARSESGPPDHARNSVNESFSPHFMSSGHPGQSTENYRQDHFFGNSTGQTHMGSPHFASDLESADSSLIGFNRNNTLQTGGSGAFEQMRLHGPGSQFGLSEYTYKRHSSPARESSHRSDFSPRKRAPFEDPSDFRDDVFPFQEAKKIKMGSFPLVKEFPEYPFSDSRQEKRFAGPPIDFPEHKGYDKRFMPGSFSYNQMNLSHPHGERDDHWKTSYESFAAGSGSLPINSDKQQIFTPESHHSPLNEEWKWEGTIAKGGTPVCRARCFPVGKVLDFMLPEFIDCTARTGLDMLAKHFYQAASTWVVFFVPESDADISFYNEFMHYLGEKQRAAVAKLGEKTTLFLVPPSDFSEKVLKVPGKLSISGVILKFEHPNSDFGSNPLEAMDSKLSSIHENISHPSTTSPDLRTSAHGQSQSYLNSFSEAFPSFAPLPTSKKPENKDLPYMRNIPRSAPSASVSGSAHLSGRVSESLNENRYYNPLQPRNPTLPSSWSPHHVRNSNTGTGNLPPHMSNNAAVHSSDDTITQEFHHSMKPRVAQETSSNQYTPGIVDIPLSGASKFPHLERTPQVSTSSPVPSLQPQQLAHLASLLGQRQQSNTGSALSLEEDSKNSSLINQPGNIFGSSQKSTLQNRGSSSDPLTSQFSQVHQMLQTSNALPVSQTNRTEPQREAPERQGNPPLQNNAGAQEETEADPQKRLQATLQLAAALLQQIQQQAKGPDQR
ncbi:RNA recognition motif domain [Macleaya cordata]|uniref:RNA recognition motif domain n=1 Tax=Macleaya cordata TaxID=56857 RepID=A0A200QPG3_MACCD|nr:RNA recognition motif domain [Macleaya cordata]